MKLLTTLLHSMYEMIRVGYLFCIVTFFVMLRPQTTWGMAFFANGRVTGTVVSYQKEGMSIKDQAGVVISVKIHEATKLKKKYWGKSKPLEFNLNDTVTAIGRWESNKHTVLLADYVRNLSIQNRKSSIDGIVVSVSDNSFILQLTDNTILTVLQFKDVMDRKIHLGEKLRLIGNYNPTEKTLSDIKKIKLLNTLTR